MSDKKLSLSIVIPAYNEERYLSACLDSIARQTEMPDEVIVVDNNSTDKTVEIAQKYPFVKVLHEKRQHQSYAQKTGFDNATGDILGRIDADCVLPADWTAKVKEYFQRNADIIAITGEPDPYDIYLKRLGIFAFDIYNLTASWIAGVRLLWGANCALRRDAWSKISGSVLQRPDVWEDFDLSFCLKKHGRVKLIHGLRVKTSFRAVHQSSLQQIRYHFRSVRTFYLRAGLLKTIIFIFSRFIAIFAYPVVLIDLYILQPIAKRTGKKFTPAG